MLGTSIVPLEALLENRIGIQGWLPIHSSIKLGDAKFTEISENSFSGGLEMAIRFTKHDDYLKVLNSAKEIGWTRGASLVRNIAKIKNNKNFTISKPESLIDLSNESTKSAKKTVKCLIEIDEAIHLPTVYEKELDMLTPVSSFVSFNIDLDNPCEMIKTSICNHDTSPKWNQQFLSYIDSEYFLDDKKFFILKIWHKLMSRNHDKLLGCASIDLTPLIYGLSHLSGWYNILDPIGNCNGQIKVNILPQENLFALKQIVMERKKSQTESRISSFGSRYDVTHCSTLSLPRLTSSDISITFNDIKPNKPSNSTNDLPEMIYLEDYKLGLKQKLNELEHLNKQLKERLQIVDSKKNQQEMIVEAEVLEFELEDHSNPDEKINQNENFIEPAKYFLNDELNKEDEMIEKNRLTEEEFLKNNVTNCEPSFQNIEILGNESKISENICIETAIKTNLDVIDSFWINTPHENTRNSSNNSSNNSIAIEVLEENPEYNEMVTF